MEASQASPASRGSAARRLSQGSAIFFVSVVLAAPFALINKGFSMLGMGTDETLHTLLRFCALMGISLLFLQILTGAFRPRLSRLFKWKTVQAFHTSTGLLGLALIICHFVLMIPSIGEHWANLNHGFFVLGPIMLLVLVTTISTALALRRSYPGLWSRLHVLNYMVFTVGLVHAMGIGTQGSALSGRIVLGVYLVIGLAGLVYRARSAAWRRRFVPATVRVRNGRA
jgi:DMSO/TMAO reductase YedYZ heme-binding membrane subunit